MKTTSLDYSDQLDAVRRQYEPLILAKLNAIKTAAANAGYEISGPTDMCVDEFRWSMLISEQGRPQDTGIDVSIAIAEQRDYEGDDGWGINFGLYIVRYGGRIVGEHQPFNFTPEVWVDSRVPYEVSTRWAYMDSVGPVEVLDSIDEDFANNTN